MTEEEAIPGYWHFLWMAFMQPISLRSRLRDAGIEDPDSSGLELWRQGGVARDCMKKSLVILSIASILVTAIVALFFNLFFGFAIHPVWTLGGLFFGVVLGIPLGFAEGVVGSVAYGLGWVIAVGVVWSAFGVAIEDTFGIAEGITSSVAWSVAAGIAGGVAAGPARESAEFGGGVSGAVIGGVAAGVAVSFALDASSDFAGGFTWEVSKAVTSGVAGGFSALIVALRIPVYFLEAFLQGILYKVEELQRPQTLQFSPILYHNLSYLPHPFLARHTLRVAATDPGLVRRILEACAIAPGQRAIGRRVLAELQAQELEKAAQDLDFRPVIDLKGTWLPGREGSDPLLLGFAEVARYLVSAEAASIPYHRLQKLERAQSDLKSLKNRLLGSGSPPARLLRTSTLPAWEKAVAELLRSAEAEASTQFANPFRAKEPLSPEQGREVFRGRENLTRMIESLLGEPGRGCSIALLGPRRTGKTSLLKMLPLLMPDAVCVFFDLQDNPIDSSASFFSALSRRAREQARRDRQLDLPDLPAGPPFESGSQWLESLDELPGGLRILLCLDEFEHLESLFPGSRRELLQLLGLIRATIQHRHRVRILVSGAAPFEELDALWNDHLINAREIRIGFLDREAAVGLLRKPIPEFPDEAVSEEVARAIFERTGGQPNLVQLYGSLLVTRLNEQDRRQAELADVARVEEDVLAQETYYFRNILQEAPPAARTALIGLAHDQRPEIDAATRRWLRRRLLLTDDGRLTMPVFGAWIRAEEGM